MIAAELAKFIDHTLLKPEATKDDVRRLCAEAIKYGFASVFVNSHFVPLVSTELKSSGISVGTVAGFPLGASATAIKSFEAAMGVMSGANEIDMVMNIGLIKERNEVGFFTDILTVVETVRSAAAEAGRDNSLVKVIIETCYLTDEEKLIAAKLIEKAKADFVKTSTSFGPKGADVRDISLLKSAVGPGLKIKASGGIRGYEQAMAMIEAGADRIGTSSGVQIMEEFLNQNESGKG
ncbi:MAG: deoxyribose-phosphate aldolase [Actinomycetota bacterium]|nr:deoxyribose-phosphate aldolase [Actinomycetota bacterium]